MLNKDKEVIFLVRERIAEYLKTKGIKQEHIANKANISPTAMSNLVSGKRNLDVEEYIRICNALEVSCDFFMPETPTPERSERR